MLLLMFFAVVVGAGTAVSPCVLPVLPAVLSASGSGGRRRPLGIVLGLTTTFAVTIVGLANVISGIGLGDNVLRDIATAVLAVFGVALLVPQLGAIVERPLAAFSRLGPRTRGDGFGSGLLVGAALGFVYTPCAGPILAAVITVSAASGRAVAVGLAYAAGTGLMLLALALGGRRILERLRRSGRTIAIQRTLGVVLVATAIVLATMLDVKLDEWIAEHIPNVNITAFVDNSHAVSTRLNDVRTKKPRFVPLAQNANLPGVEQPMLYDYAKAPNFVGTERWFNTPGGRPLTIAGLHGHVVLIDFWTYTCINCIRTLPYLEAWDRRYRSKGLTIVGVEAPEFPFERDAGNVLNAIHQFGIHYPVVQDNNLDTWDVWGNEAWPTDYLIDATGEVRYVAIGEGDYSTTEDAIRELLAQAGARNLGGAADARGVIVPSMLATPETYLGTARASGWQPGTPKSGSHIYTLPAGSLFLNSFAYSGTWKIASQQALALANAQIHAEVQAKNVYIVLSPPARGTGHVAVTVDGKATKTISVTQQRLYTVASFASDSRHLIGLKFSAGTSGYSFTFG
ncbi:MAG TPA: cytochrome c biogenesis protein CcdA [Solirubrobacteraceae bacterium]|jgi:cytochrome c biogenesis protein CcdA/thiol-disulfide isomerase/thioredoxin|nr:cytochrome c biogenesis protein CcdA [Solirubrobacteraceae bacterium]